MFRTEFRPGATLVGAGCTTSCKVIIKRVGTPPTTRRPRPRHVIAFRRFLNRWWGRRELQVIAAIIEPP